MSQVDPQTGEPSQEEFETAIDATMEVSKQILMLMDVTGLNPMRQALACIGALASVVISAPAVVDPLISFLRKMTETLKKEHGGKTSAFEDLIRGVGLDQLNLKVDSATELGTIKVKGKPLFNLGMVEIYVGLRDAMKPSRLLEVLGLYLAGDWGPYVDEEDAAVNRVHAEAGVGRIFAVHKVDPNKDLSDDNKFYIITNVEHTETKAMMPSEYQDE